MSIRLEHEHGSDISVLRACPNPDADLVAIGGDHTVEVLQVNASWCRQLAVFHIGTRVTALAWSPRSTSPSHTDEWGLELVAAGDDLNLRLLTKTTERAEDVYVFGGGLSGHRRKVNDLTFCGGFGQDSFRYLASVSDDKILLFWDMIPPRKASPGGPEPTISRSPTPAQSPGPPSEEPVAFGVPYKHPLHSVASHPSTSKELVVSDVQGSVFVVDWRVAPAEDDPDEGFRGMSVAQLVDPRALADARTGMQNVWGGSVAWKQQDADIIGATYGARWVIWDLRKLQGGKPIATGSGFEHGSHRFRWCPTDPQLFALSPLSPLDGAAVSVFNIAYAQSTARRLALHPRPHRVRDFDWLGQRQVQGCPCFAAAVGRKMLIVDVLPEE